MRAVWMVAILIATVLAGCGSGPDVKDSDGDGLNDDMEEFGWSVLVTLIDRRIQYWATSNPHQQDSDGDGLLDLHERLVGTDPNKADTDEDGLTDCQEAFHSLREQCEDPSWEGQTDGGLPTDPLWADSDPARGRYRNLIGLSDETGTLKLPIERGDGIADGEEYLGFEITLPGGGTKFVRTDPMRLDSDGDFLEDGEERFVYGTDPTHIDTDGDGCMDGRDPVPTMQERYLVRDLRVSLNASRPARDVAFVVTAADGQTEAPPVRLQPGQPHTFPLDHVPRIKPGSCGYTAGTPIVPVEVVGFVPNEGALDFTSLTNPEASFRIQFHARDLRFGWTPSETFVAGPVTWRGLDGELSFDVSVVQAS
jgi:hypothetical protein